MTGLHPLRSHERRSSDRYLATFGGGDIGRISYAQRVSEEQPLAPGIAIEVQEDHERSSLEYYGAIISKLDDFIPTYNAFRPSVPLKITRSHPIF
jgi:hypothetical protein